MDDQTTPTVINSQLSAHNISSLYQYYSLLGIGWNISSEWYLGLCWGKEESRKLQTC